MSSQPPDSGKDEPVASASDSDLMTRIAFGDQTAYGELVRRYWALLVHYASSLLGAADAAEDAVQETFVRVWERRRKWVARGSAKGFLYTIVRNLCFQERDRVEIRRRFAAEPSLSPQVAHSAEDILRDQEIHDAFRQALEGLPPKRREVFLLVFVHGLSYAEAAEALGITVSTVGNQVSSALRAMREALKVYSQGAT